MKIITGKTGTNHVNSDDDRALHMGIFGTETYVLSIGECLKATMIDANTCRIAAGELVMFGCHARIEPGNYDDLQIDSGSAGYNRKDLIVARYRKEAGIENVTLEVIKGVVSTGDAERPSYTTGHLYWGTDICDMPLYEISLNGINIAAVTPLFDKLYQNLSNVYTKEEIDSGFNTITDTVSKAFTEINNKINSLQNNINKEIDEKYDTLSSSIEGKVSSLKNELQVDIKNVNNALTDKISNLNSTMSSKVDNLTSTVNNQKEELADLKNRLKELESK